MGNLERAKTLDEPQTSNAWQAAAGRLLYNTTDMDRGAADDGDTAAMLEGTQVRPRVLGPPDFVFDGTPNPQG